MHSVIISAMRWGQRLLHHPFMQALTPACIMHHACMPELQADAIFMSPPWGGPQYTYADTFQPEWLLPGFNASTLRLVEVALSTVQRTVSAKLRGTMLMDAHSRMLGSCMQPSGLCIHPFPACPPPHSSALHGLLARMASS